MIPPLSPSTHRPAALPAMSAGPERGKVERGGRVQFLPQLFDHKRPKGLQQGMQHLAEPLAQGLAGSGLGHQRRRDPMECQQGVFEAIAKQWEAVWRGSGPSR